MLNLFRRPERRATIQRLYGVIVAQARQPAFYTDFAVPDTIEGRFELVLLHTFLVCHRLKSGDEASRDMSQMVFDAFLDDMDRTLREMGVGDLSVPKRMKKIGQAFYGRAGVFDAALQADAAPGALDEAVARNVYEVEPAALGTPGKALATYVRQAVAVLAATPAEVFARGEVHFPAPNAGEGAVHD
ncbi:ubiquinol-cytochrome C chaperone family protein [Roseixanthobacter glucoisosaccharinicivorans]|uniref:ubiquinol-cytochrome C chaperone family protein n=1 Tax=Roseixanthobacter glucoisosaccharinicivorans TaxID=3119923 RepID=UPI00372B6089